MSLSLLPLSATGPPPGPAAAVMAPMEYASSPDSPSDSPSALPAGPGAEKTGKSGDSGAFENSETVRAPRESAESTAPRTHAPRASYGWPTGSPASVVRGFDPPTVTWGSGHRGVDLSLQAGSPVLAAGDGTVVFAGAVAGRPVVSIDHADGIRTTYEPVEASVAAGDVVTRGTSLRRGGRSALGRAHRAEELHQPVASSASRRHPAQATEIGAIGAEPAGLIIRSLSGLSSAYAVHAVYAMYAVHAVYTHMQR